MLSTEDRKWLTDLFDTRFAEQNERIDTRFAEQNERIDKRFAEQEKRLAKQDKKLEQIQKEARTQRNDFLEALDRHAKELRKESDARFAAMMEDNRQQNESFQDECLARIDAKLAESDRFQKDSLERIDNKLNEIDQKFADHEKAMAVIIENQITARLDAFLEYLPGAYKSYGRLERRVDKIEMKQNLLEKTVLDHIQDAE